MFELSELLKQKKAPSGSKTSAGSKSALKAALFSQTEAVADLVLQAFRFEGWNDPDLLANKSTEVGQYIERNQADILFIELTQTADLIADAERFNRMIPNSVSVVIIGNQDSISVLRAIQQLGFYYLYWPVEKPVFIDFVSRVISHRAQKLLTVKKRRAKRVGFYGCKGGVGCSFLTAEIAQLLASDHQSRCVLVNHNRDRGNLDVMLGKLDLNKRPIPSDMTAASLDEGVAQTLLTKVTDRLDYLAFEQEDENANLTREFTDTVSDWLSFDCHFILEDLSASLSVDRDANWMTTKLDCLVMVLDGSVSALREATLFQKKLKAAMADSERRLRILVVLNHSRRERNAEINDAAIEKYLGNKPDITIPHAARFSEIKLRGNHLYQGNNRTAKTLKALSSLILGERASKPQSLFSRWFNKR